MSRCAVCGRRLSLLALIRGFFNRSHKSYPFTAIDGVRKEQPVRYLCERCSLRADKHRQEGVKENKKSAAKE